MRPTIVCLCGSTRFGEAFKKANLTETLAGKIVLSIGCDMRSDEALELPIETKEMLDELHLRKIDLADEVLILNVGGYIGESTSRELAYAQKLGKRIRFLEPRKKLEPKPNKIAEFLEQNPNWSELVRDAKQRGCLRCCVESGYMEFVPVLPLEAGMDIDEQGLAEILAENFDLGRDFSRTNLENIEFLSEVLESLQVLKAGKNALIILGEERDPPEGYAEAWTLHHDVVPLPPLPAVAA